MQWLNSSAIGAGLLVAGLYFLHVELFAAPIAEPHILIIGALAVLVGAVWLFIDFIVPILHNHHLK